MEASSSGLDGGNEVAQNDTPAAAAPHVDRRRRVGPRAGHGPEGRVQQDAEEEAVKDHPRAAGASPPGPTGRRPWSRGLLGAGAAALARRALCCGAARGPR